jgi:large subunit ribosomal protein L21
MYAVFEDGSRQYRVSEGDVVTLDYRDAEVGTRLEFNRVLLYANGPDAQIGRPTLEGLRVLAEEVDHPSKKYQIQKYRRRKNYRRFKGHRQWFTKVRVRHILLPGVEAPPPPPPPAPKAPEQPAQQQPAAPQTPPAPPAQPQS